MHAKIKKLHKILLERAVAKATGNEYHLVLLKGLVPGKLTVAEVDMLNLMLDIPDGTMISIK